MNTSCEAQFRKIVWAYYRKHGRHELPWRRTHDPYKILVSEVMLQQTQVERVKPFYEAFVRKFPTAKKLGAAPLSSVLAAWQGLGYNRRAKLLHAAAKQIVSRTHFKTDFADRPILANVGPRRSYILGPLGPSLTAKRPEYRTNVFVRSVEASAGGQALLTNFFGPPAPFEGFEMSSTRFDLVTRSNLVEKLEELPGVGSYTARAVLAFAQNQDVVLVETNIRTAVLHHFFPKRKKVSDEEIGRVLAAVLPHGRAREWYYALMDYGAFLKRSGVQLNAKSKHYAKQSRFGGSLREARGAILKELARGSSTSPRLLGLLGDDRRVQIKTALAALAREGLVEKRGAVYALAR